MNLADPVGAGLKGSTLGPRFGTVWDTEAWENPQLSEAICSRSGRASPILWCCHLRKWFFPAVLVGWAWSLPFLLGICLWETSEEEAEMTTYFTD